MPRVNPLQPAINAGEFSPRMSARVDFGKYPSAAASCKNMIPLAQGGAMRRPAGSVPADGYLSEFVFIDGLQLDASSFGEFNSDGVWVPIDPSGLTFGTKGFYLDFKVAPGTGNGAGTDVSGNANHFTDSGLAAVDQFSSSPTNNHCTMVSLPEPAKITDTFADGNMSSQIVSISASSPEGWHIGTVPMGPTGKYYFEFSVESLTSLTNMYLGICDALQTNDGTAPPSGFGNNVYWTWNDSARAYPV